jgi:transcriptional regulator with PAS, ATPase and Fis domain
MPLYLQVKLLRALQERTITRLGASRPVSVDIRIVAATNDNLEDLMAQNMFRRDLYYRLNVIPLQVPPLRKRLDDLDLLVAHFANKYCTLFNKNPIKLPSSIVNKMRLYEWPGNIRELENAIEYLVNIAGKDGAINTSTIPAGFLSRIRTSPENEQSPRSQQAIIPLKELEKQAILRALSVFGDTTQGKKEAAARLGISLATLYRKMDKD